MLNFNLEVEVLSVSKPFVSNNKEYVFINVRQTRVDGEYLIRGEVIGVRAKADVVKDFPVIEDKKYRKALLSCYYSENKVPATKDKKAITYQNFACYEIKELIKNI